MKRSIGLVLFVIVLIVLVELYVNTGFLQADAIDTKDLAHWQYENGVVKNANWITLEGSSGKCWVMAHGYTSTPDELRAVAAAVHDTFNDTVYVPLLYGHGTVPSNIEKFSVDDWYNEIAGVADEHHCTYLLGSSLGASLVLRYAELHNLSGVVSVGTPFALEPTYIPTGLVVSVLEPIGGYLKKNAPGETVHEPMGSAQHISTYSFPLKGVGELDEFNGVVKADLAAMHDPILFIHSSEDGVANIKGAKEAYDEISAEKSFVTITASHLVFRDYDKEKAIAAVLDFRAKN